MSKYAEALSALPEFRAELLRGNTGLTAQVLRPLNAPFADAPSQANVHATGIGIRAPNAPPDDVVLKLFVFSRRLAVLASRWRDFDVAIEELPVQTARAAVPNRQRQRPILGGVGIAPLGAGYVGTLGCFLQMTSGQEIVALSNNHVLADVNRLPIGSPICQPGPETAPTTVADVFATLTQFIPLSFGAGTVNDHDAAIARVSDATLITTGALFGIPHYAPGNVVQPTPSMSVTKSGRTTGITSGMITAVNVNGVQVNYADAGKPPQIGVFNNAVQVVGNAGTSFSLPGDSGSLIVTDPNGEPTALLFAGDSVNTFATPLNSLCNRLGAWPI